MPFRSKRQQRAMFGGHIPGLTKEDAHRWADETPNIKKLPDRAPAEKGKPTLRSKKAGSENDRLHDALEERVKRMNKQSESDLKQERMEKKERKEEQEKEREGKEALKEAASAFEGLEDGLAQVFKLAAFEPGKLTVDAARKALNTEGAAARAKGIWGRGKEILSGSRIKKLQQGTKELGDRELAIKDMASLGLPTENFAKDTAAAADALKSETLRERLKTHGSRGAIVGGVGGGAVLMHRRSRQRGR